MPVTSSDIAHLQSAGTGSSGGAITASSITSGVANNVWPDVSDAERLAGIVIPRKTFWKNNHGSDSMIKPVLYTPVLPTNATLEIGLGLNHADDDDLAQGNMTAFGANAVLALQSTGADTRIATIYGLDGSSVPQTEDVTLTGATEVLSLTTWSKVWAVWLSAQSGSLTVTARQGAGGTTRGTIGVNAKICWLWVTAGSKGAGIKLPDLAPAQNYGMWRRLTVAAAAGAVRPNTLTTRIEES